MALAIDLAKVGYLIRLARQFPETLKQFEHYRECVLNWQEQAQSCHWSYLGNLYAGSSLSGPKGAPDECHLPLRRWGLSFL